MTYKDYKVKLDFAMLLLMIIARNISSLLKIKIKLDY